MVSRLVEAKGIDLLSATAERLLSLGAQLIILGTGEEKYERAFLELQEKHPESVRALLCFDRDLSKKLYAAADIFLMPSYREPCGLAQMTACRYGTVPVVRSTGGLADSIIPYGRAGGCGFMFFDPSPDNFFECVWDAVTLFSEESGEWERLCRTAMRTDFSWRRSARRYLSLYCELTEEE
jgi:starch synthase